MSKIRSDDVLLASFKNHVFEVSVLLFSCETKLQNYLFNCIYIFYSPPISYLSVY